MCPAQELAVTNEGSRNYRGIFISIFVLLGMSFLIIASIYCVNPDILKLNALSLIKEKITLDEVLLGDLNGAPFNGQWLSPVVVVKSASVMSPESSDIHQGLGNTIDDPTPKSSMMIKDDLLLFEDKQNNIQLLTLKAARDVVVSGTIWSRKQLLNFTTLVANNSALSSLDPPMSDYHISADNRWLLVASGRRRVYRHTFTATYYVYNISNDELIPITISNANANNTIIDNNDNNKINSQIQEQQQQAAIKNIDAPHRLQYAMWTPQNGLILVHNNDIYYKSSIEAEPQRITDDGLLGVRFNGIPDWLYEEEILSSSHALRLSPSGSWLAFMSFDDSSVDTVHIPFYGPESEQLQQLLSIRYPKAGRPNPRVFVRVAQLFPVASTQSQSSSLSLSSSLLQLPADLATQQHYVTDIKWLNDLLLTVAWTNRVQNVTHLLLCSPQQQRIPLTSVNANAHINSHASSIQWQCHKNAHQAMTGGWADPIEVYPASLSSTGEHYLSLMHKFEDDNVGHFKHVARVSVATGEYTFLTSGHFEVTQINAYDPTKEQVIYTATRDGAPGERHAYLLDINTNHSECLTCQMPAPNECLYNELKVAPSMQYFVVECLGPGVPRIQLRAVRPLKLDMLKSANANVTATEIINPDAVDRVIDSVLNDSRLVWVIEHNHELRERLKLKALPQVRQFQLPIQGTHYNASVQLLLPAQLKLDESTQYPMIVSVYAGPQSQRVDTKFYINYGYYLASSKKTIYAMIDGRGSGYQGSRMAFEIYHKLGSVEIDDQLQVTRQLLKKFSFIDPHKVAIWGWSYGGYASSMALARGLPRATAAAAAATAVPAPASANYTLIDSRNAPTGTEQQVHSTASHHSTTNTRQMQARKPQMQILPNRILIDKPVFECAVSVAPVTDWIYYDTAYTERYMGSPYVDESFGGDYNDTLAQHESSATNQKQINERYKSASLVEQAAHVNKKRLLLVHGTADDNVHFQQSIMLMKALTRRNVLYETQLYPDENHAIDHRTSKIHLYTTIDHFFTECFELANPLVFSPLPSAPILT
ncbi:Dipeptidyl peptidase 4 [Fragariocoptes setiger]|uniref:Dipeptidyl peptidase 4 n=1 Tax=Fragariocoptes setiger TaxID=1670756 RepID=A0ABQ7SAG9_9ACAR|nr:Dipeptidyl peptidase 4 [Fragariocoptes setiger]